MAPAALIAAGYLTWRAVFRRTASPPSTECDVLADPEAHRDRQPDMPDQNKSASGRLAFAGLLIALVGLPIACIVLYKSNETTPLPREAPGELFLVVDRPGVKAQMEVNISNPDSDHPIVFFIVRLSDPAAHFALLGQGDWAFTNDPSFKDPNAIAPQSGQFVDSKGLMQTMPSTVVVDNQPGSKGSAFYVRELLPRAVEQSGRGHSVGTLPQITADIVPEGTSISHIKGKWSSPLTAALITVTIPTPAGGGQLEWAHPPATLQTGSEVDWSGGGGIGSLSWSMSNPLLADISNAAAIALGVLLSIWGSVSVALAQYELGRWTRGRHQSRAA